MTLRLQMRREKGNSKLNRKVYNEIMHFVVGSSTKDME